MASPTPPTPVRAPDLHIPHSAHIVSVSIINTPVSYRGVPAATQIGPSIPGHQYLGTPIFSSYIHHPGLKRSILFDLGLRKDWEKLSPPQIAWLKSIDASVEGDVPDVLTADGIPLDSIEAIIWSHWHNDHCGDPSRFGPGTALIVGPGTREHLLPGYPADQNGLLLESDYAGRELRELSFEDEARDGGQLRRIGRFRALDYFGDGSFYVLDTPGHTHGHLSALARVAAGQGGRPDSFVFLAGDAAHHAGELRPSDYHPLPLPEEVGAGAIITNPFTDGKGGDNEKLAGMFCLGGALERLLPGQDRTKSFYKPARYPLFDAPGLDVDEAACTVGKLQEADAADNVLVVLAHDEWLLDVVDFFPKTVNDFAAKGWVEKSRWRFLKDFAGAAGWEGHVEGKREWAPRAKSE